MKKLAPVLALLLGSLATTGAHAGMNVLNAWYGASCGTQSGNVTLPMKMRCDGRDACQYTVDSPTLGDPAPRCAKNLVVLFACDGQQNVRLAQLPAEANGRVIELVCGR